MSDHGFDAHYAGTCDECGQTYSKGTRVTWNDRGRLIHTTCENGHES